MTTKAKRQAVNLSQRRQYYLRRHPELQKLRGQAKRQALDALLASKDVTHVREYFLDDMTTDAQTRETKVFRANRKRFALYRAGLSLAAERARRARDRDTARTIDAHLKPLVDASPREVRCYYPGEWKVVSRALRPEGSNPQSVGARRLLALYQHIVRTYRVLSASH